MHACVGKVDFPTEVLRENTAAFVRAVLEARPTRFRGKPPKSITLSTLTGRGVPLDPRLWGAPGGEGGDDPALDPRLWGAPDGDGFGFL